MIPQNTQLMVRAAPCPDFLSSARHTKRTQARRSCGSSTARHSTATRSRTGPASTAIACPTSRAARAGASRRLSPRVRRAVALLGRRRGQLARGAGRIGRRAGAADGGRRARPRRPQRGRDQRPVHDAPRDGDAARRAATRSPRSPIARRARPIASLRRRAPSSRRWSRARAPRGSARRGSSVCRGFFDLVRLLAEDHPQRRRQRREVGDHRQQEGDAPTSTPN